MASDSSAGAPQAKGGSGIMGLPIWVWGAGLGVVVVVLYLRHKSSTAGSTTSDTASSSPLSGQVAYGSATDPATGQPIDPLTGLPYITSAGGGTASTGTIAGWIGAAEAALKGAGFAPALVEQALYDFTNGNPLSNQEGNVINRALGLVGHPPDLLPFIGTIPNPKPPVPIVLPPAKAPHIVVKPPKVPTPGRKPKPITKPVVHLTPVGAGMNFGASVLSGKTPLPAGVKVPTGYKLKPGTRILTKATK